MTHLVADGDLAATADDADAAADLFLEAGVCVFEAALPPSLVAACRSVLERKSRLLDERLAARGVDLQAPWRFNEVCRRRFARYDLRGWALSDAIFTESLLLWSAAPWLPFVRSVLGDDVKELWRGVVDNRPGSETQGWHRDGGFLFPNGAEHRRLLPLLTLQHADPSITRLAHSPRGLVVGRPQPRTASLHASSFSRRRPASALPDHLCASGRPAHR